MKKQHTAAVLAADRKQREAAQRLMQISSESAEKSRALAVAQRAHAEAEAAGRRASQVIGTLR